MQAGSLTRRAAPTRRVGLQRTKMKQLGQTKLKVSPLCMGTMTFGREADRATSAAMFNRCREAGINFFDCADIYAQGESETILGGLIRDCRDKVVVTSKVYYAVGKKLEAVGLSRSYIMSAVEASLKRLGTDRIDIYFVHHFDESTPLEETLGALDDLARQGKIRFAGASNFAAWQIEKALGLSAGQGWARFECIQPMYNLVKRQAEVEIFPMAQAEKLGVVTYSPLGGGLLTGKYGDERPSATGRLSTDDIYQRRYGDRWMHESVRGFVRLAKERGIDPVSLAVAWASHHPAVTAPIIGARSVEQLDASLGALQVKMTDELYREISALTPAPAPATDRSEET
jgi:aryl-alcohol dehydrogenase-like predicted oxidoreductase